MKGMKGFWWGHSDNGGVWVKINHRADIAMQVSNSQRCHMLKGIFLLWCASFAAQLKRRGAMWVVLGFMFSWGVVLQKDAQVACWPARNWIAQR